MPEPVETDSWKGKTRGAWDEPSDARNPPTPPPPPEPESAEKGEAEKEASMLDLAARAKESSSIMQRELQRVGDHNAKWKRKRGDHDPGTSRGSEDAELTDSGPMMVIRPGLVYYTAEQLAELMKEAGVNSRESLQLLSWTSSVSTVL